MAAKASDIPAPSDWTDPVQADDYLFQLLYLLVTDRSSDLEAWTYVLNQEEVIRPKLLPTYYTDPDTHDPMVLTDGLSAPDVIAIWASVASQLSVAYEVDLADYRAIIEQAGRAYLSKKAYDSYIDDLEWFVKETINDIKKAGDFGLTGFGLLFLLVLIVKLKK